MSFDDVDCWYLPPSLKDGDPNFLVPTLLHSCSTFVLSGTKG